MNKSVNFTIFGKITGQPRPRATKDNAGRIRMYDPLTGLNYKGLVRASLDMALREIYEKDREAAALPFEGKRGIGICIDCYYQIPKSVSKKERQAILDLPMRPTKKPDADNIAKIIMDALNGYLWRDDKEVTSLHVTKKYTTGLERVEVAVSTL